MASSPGTIFPWTLSQTSVEEMSDDEDMGYILNISLMSPQDWAIPLYGYLMPILVIITTITNSFIVLVLSQKHLRTPTNLILLSMALTDLLTGCSSVPWFLYYYTLQGYRTDATYGISNFWCHAHAYLFEILPSIFHTAAIWLTVFLAIQRYIYVCVPSSVHQYCTPRTTKIIIYLIIFASFLSVLPEMAAKQRFTYVNKQTTRIECYTTITEWVDEIGRDNFFSTYYWFRVILHGVPCCLLLIFICKLTSTIKQAEAKKKSWANLQTNSAKSSFTGRNSIHQSPGRSLYATNRMLAVICSVFLLLEIPASVLYTLQFLMAKNIVESTPEYISVVNRTIVIRNLLIVLASPIQFAVYCSMSEQFRLTVRQLFTSKLLFVAQAQSTFHGGKRYSLVLIDVDQFDARRRKRDSSRLLNLFDKTVPQRKLARQVSLQESDLVRLQKLKRRGGSMRPSSDLETKRQRILYYRGRAEDVNEWSEEMHQPPVTSEDFV